MRRDHLLHPEHWTKRPASLKRPLVDSEKMKKDEIKLAATKSKERREEFRCEFHYATGM